MQVLTVDNRKDQTEYSAEAAVIDRRQTDTGIIGEKRTEERRREEGDRRWGAWKREKKNTKKKERKEGKRKQKRKDREKKVKDKQGTKTKQKIKTTRCRTAISTKNNKHTENKRK